ncbi:hypothetical protein DBR06_SOUSAS40310005, partial [Sousa chinensis]
HTLYLSTIFLVTCIGFSLKPSQIYCELVLIVSVRTGCGIVMNFGGSFLGLMVFFFFCG